MTQRTTIEFNHDFLDALSEQRRRYRAVLANLLFDAISGDPESAEILEKKFGFKIVAQRRVRAPSISPKAGAEQ